MKSTLIPSWTRQWEPLTLRVEHAFVRAIRGGWSDSLAAEAVLWTVALDSACVDALDPIDCMHVTTVNG